MNIILMIAVFVLAAAAIFIYLRTSGILKSLDSMLDDGIKGEFHENNFDEGRLSRLESKMRRYITSGKTSQNRIKEERNHIKSLISDISHQTKTPISNILLYSELIEENGSLDEKGRELLQNIKEQADKLNFLVQALVKTSRLENGIVSIISRPYSVRELIMGLDFAEKAKAKGIALKISEIPDIVGVFDPKWTAEAISNIVDNAVKYTSAGGSVTVSAAEYEMFVKIDIEDSGIGIDEGESAKIFGRFYRSPRVHNEQGVGIGLYLAREIISGEGGYIKVSSQVGKGSLFSVFLPKA